MLTPSPSVGFSVDGTNLCGWSLHVDRSSRSESVPNSRINHVRVTGSCPCASYVGAIKSGVSARMLVVR
jgi:hypothetical protein